MSEMKKDYKQCIDLALNNAKIRMKHLGSLDKKSVLDEYKEWIEEEVCYQSILILREDPMI